VKAEWRAAGKDKFGRQMIEHHLALEEKWRKEGNPRKYIKVHPVWDVKDFLTDDSTPVDENEDDNSVCGWCSI
jgi:hypothetical protein